MTRRHWARGGEKKVGGKRIGLGAVQQEWRHFAIVQQLAANESSKSCF